jgi:hypothetical protein
MFPIYKFELTIGSTRKRAYPVYKDDLTKEFELQNGQQFFRAKLTGSLIFQRDDYERIVAASFETQFLVDVLISEDAGSTWENYWSGNFWKTDCEFDMDSKTVKVTPTVDDSYSDIIAGMDKEFNLIDLTPEICSIKADKRPMIQAYIPGQSSISCFLAGMWWEESCDIVEESETIDVEGTTVNKLTDYFHFGLNAKKRIIMTSGVGYIPDCFYGNTPTNNFAPFTFYSGDYKFIFRTESGSGYVDCFWEIARQSDDVVMWQYSQRYGVSFPGEPWDESVYRLYPVEGTGAEGRVDINWRDLAVYTRYISDVEEINNIPLFDLPPDDMTDNRNYKKVFPYNRTDTVHFSSRLSDAPTKWGIYQPGKYYVQPQVSLNPELFPIARNSWGRVSIWFSFHRFDEADEMSGRKQIVIRDTYPLSSAISVLLRKISKRGSTKNVPFSRPGFYDGSLQTFVVVDYADSTELIPVENVTSIRYTGRMGGTVATWFGPNQEWKGQTVDARGNTIEDVEIMTTKPSGAAYVSLSTRNNNSPNPPTVEANCVVNGGVTHAASSEYSVFLYGTNPIMTDSQRLFIAPKSNIINSGYDQPAQSAFITLRSILDMLRDCFRCYWFVDENGRFRIEHIQYFLLGGSYTGTPTVGIDLTQLTSLPSGKPWSYSRNVYKFDKPDMACRYQFGWMDEVTELFKGYPIDIVSKYVNPDNVEDISITKFTSDIDYVLLNPGSVSQDGFMLLSAVLQSGEYVLPYVSYYFNNANHVLQNGYVSFMYLQAYYAYDMPARYYTINGVNKTAIGVKKLKTQQISFYIDTEPNLSQLIKTDLGNGKIEKLSVNLSSRNAKASLRYDTE